MGGVRTKRLFPETPLRANSCWRESLSSMWTATHSGIQGKAWNPLNAPSECVQADSEKRHQLLFAFIVSRVEAELQKTSLSQVTQVLHLQLARCVVTGKHAIETSPNVFRCSRTSDENWNSHQCRANSQILYTRGFKLKYTVVHSGKKKIFLQI